MTSLQIWSTVSEWVGWGVGRVGDGVGMGWRCVALSKIIYASTAASVEVGVVLRLCWNVDNINNIRLKVYQINYP